MNPEPEPEPEAPLPLPGNDPVPSAGCGKSDSPGSGNSFTIDADGMSRSYIVASPSGYDANKPYKLVFAWHYLGGSASGIALSGYYGLERMARGEAIFVSSQGLNAGWGSPNDIPFATALVEWMKDNYCVDTTRIFSTGFSYGAIMSNRVGCSLGNEFRAIAPMSGSGPIGRGRCQGQVAALVTHGTSDAIVPFSGGQGSRDHWVMTNSCGGDTSPDGACVLYQGCDEGYPVKWCEYAGGHTQPRGAASLVWEFFSQF